MTGRLRITGVVCISVSISRIKLTVWRVCEVVFSLGLETVLSLRPIGWGFQAAFHGHAEVTGALLRPVSDLP